MRDEDRVYVRQLLTAALEHDEAFVEMTLNRLEKADFERLFDALAWLQHLVRARLGSNAFPE
jgi:hypothetical protein